MEGKYQRAYTANLVVAAVVQVEVELHRRSPDLVGVG